MRFEEYVKDVERERVSGRSPRQKTSCPQESRLLPRGRGLVSCGGGNEFKLRLMKTALK